jgi:FKBP-type peptidyl-prolyl cis-trans isomerase
LNQEIIKSGKNFVAKYSGSTFPGGSVKKRTKNTISRFMRLQYKIILMALAGTQLVQTTARADDQPALNNEKDKASYAIGMNIGANLKRNHFDVNLDILKDAIKDALAGHEMKLTEQQAREAITAYQQSVVHQIAETNRHIGEAFLAENKKKEGVKVIPVALADGTTAELQYLVLTNGTGATPASNDTVTVNYRGTLINGTEFDSSARRGKAAQFAVNHVIRGWTDALQQMKTGSKWQLFVPDSLAYGDRGNQGIEPGSTLIFEVELVGIQQPPPPKPAVASPPQQPVTSDIIRVPSAEELKAGAKVEVIKAQDVDKAKAAADQTNAPK